MARAAMGAIKIERDPYGRRHVYEWAQSKLDGLRDRDHSDKDIRMPAKIASMAMRRLYEDYWGDSLDEQLAAFWG